MLRARTVELTETDATNGVMNALLAENLVEAENAKDYERLWSVIANDAALHPGNHGGIAAVQQRLIAFYTAFPDHHRSVERWVPLGDTVVVHWHMTGTHLGTWDGLSPTGRTIAIDGCSIWDFADLRVRAMWTFTDRAELLAQLGLPTTFAATAEQAAPA